MIRPMPKPEPVTITIPAGLARTVGEALVDRALLLEQHIATLRRGHPARASLERRARLQQERATGGVPR